MIEWNTVKYIDCMNEENGLPTLENKSVDLCITDPPYNKGYKGYKGYNESYHTRKASIIYYPDEMAFESYKEWCRDWFLQLKRVCEKIIVSIGITNLSMWYGIESPDDIFYGINRMGAFGSRIAVFNKIEPWLYFGDCKQQFTQNIFLYTRKEKHDCIHPCPRSKKIIEKIVHYLKPKSVIDPFMGSGTTAEVCTKLGIPWVGYEINEVYSQDINKRLKNCKKEPFQSKLVI